MKKVFKTLILDDDAGIRELIHNILSKKMGFEEGGIVLLDNTDNAISLATSNEYDLIISDIHLGNLNDNKGLAFIKNLLDVKGGNYRSKVLVVSGDYDGLEEAKQFGVICLKKPFGIYEFQEAVRDIIRSDIMGSEASEIFHSIDNGEKQ